jgi:hypothetical protein
VITSFDFAECDDDEAALVRSLDMLGRRDQATAVEVTEGSRVVLPFRTPSVSLDAAPRPAG